MWNVATLVGASKSSGFSLLVELVRKAFLRQSIRKDLSVPEMSWMSILSSMVEALLEKWKKRY